LHILAAVREKRVELRPCRRVSATGDCRHFAVLPVP
jgi:hypothetical protein